MKTARQRIATVLRTAPATATEIGEDLSLPTSVVYDHLEHVSRSVDGDAEFLVAPPTCRDCGFDRFDEPVTYPSRCPDCKSERIDEPAFVIK